MSENKLKYEDLTNKQRKYFLEQIFNGVGSREYIMPPQSIFKSCAVRHDFYYWVGKSEEDKNQVDKDFLYEARQKIRTRYTRKQTPLFFIKKPFYYTLAHIYYLVLKKLGKKAFEYDTHYVENFDEFLVVVDNYYDKNPKSKRPIDYKEWIKKN